MPSYHYLIVGSGLFGSTFAHMAAKAGKRCLVIDKRPHLGGNVYCEDMEGIHVHKYGAHIFHTSNKEVWDFVNGIVPFNRYTNSPVASYKGKLYNLPFNMNTFYQMWGVTTPEAALAKIEEQRAEAKAAMLAAGVSEPRNLEEQALLLAGRDIYEALVKGYTEKQWGRPCTELPAFIIRRLPVRFTYDNNYFNDPYQGIPEEGYNTLIDKLLEGCDVRLGVDYIPGRAELNALADKIVYSGSIDEFFNFQLGHLEYRTVRFDTQILDMPDFQHNAVVNYTSPTQLHTRIIEHKHFTCFGKEVMRNPQTVISYEYSVEWKKGMEPFYPLNNQRNQSLYERYTELAKTTPNVLFGGRLAEYKYYDMDKVIEKDMQLPL